MPKIEVVSTDDLPCHRCQGRLYLAVRVPHPYQQPTPESQASFAVLVPLCPACDAESPAAQSLLAFFAIHECVSDGTLALFGELLRRWISELEYPRLDVEIYESEIEQWMNGGFD